VQHFIEAEGRVLRLKRKILDRGYTIEVTTVSPHQVLADGQYFLRVQKRDVRKVSKSIYGDTVNSAERRELLLVLTGALRAIITAEHSESVQLWRSLVHNLVKPGEPNAATR